ncbi:MAG: efflux RND transporter periplasmic adaptor subunit [Phycisphaerales bacterium]|nr:efflux RND transporter periplasmic adaptor subunit [Phycisphaerales bacterium]
MATVHAKPKSRLGLKTIIALLFAVGVIALMAWLVGAFRPKVGSAEDDHAATRAIGSGHVVDVALRTIPLEETAVGEIQPVRRIELASRLLARVMEVNAIAGQGVEQGEVLVRLEDNDLLARRDQATSAVAQAQAELDQAKLEESRIRSAFEGGGVTDIELNRATNASRGAEANLSRMKQHLTEAQTVLEYATIRSPIDGIVVDKRINSGDTVSPGQVVVTVLDPTRMQIVASVRESLSRALHVGDQVMVQIDVLEHACTGLVSEIVPEAESSSRTFQVKVTGPCPEGVYAGMFGRLSIPVGQQKVLLIAKHAVRTIGQVDCVDVAVDGQRRRRAVRLGRDFGDEVEVLSGLAAGEQIVIDAPAEGH